MSDHILVVDDEKEIADLVELYLTHENYIVHKFHSSTQAFECVNTTPLDLAIIDIMMPEMDGFELCRRIREQHHYPIIMLTAKDQEIDQINGLTLGADDYVTKPFRPLEMVARVKAQLRRYKKYSGSDPHPDNDFVLEHSTLVLNIKTHECFLDEKPLALTPTEFSILRILLQRKGQVVSSEELFHEIWKDEYYSKSNNTITVHIRHLREKMNDRAEKSRFIKTIWGVGYKIENN